MEEYYKRPRENTWSLFLSASVFLMYTDPVLLVADVWPQVSLAVGVSPEVPHPHVIPGLGQLEGETMIIVEVR